MRNLLALALLLFSSTVLATDVKISQLPLGSAASAGVNDSFPYVAATTNITKRLTLWDLINIPPLVSTYAPKASPVFSGTATFGGPISAGSTINATGTVTSNSVVVGSAPNKISGLATIGNGAGLLTLPNSTDTIVGRATTDTLTNKTISGASNTFSAIGDGSLSTSYIKADGTRALSGSWNVGAFNITASSFIGALTGNASTATALAANPADCSANQFATTIAANGDLTCAQPSFSNISGTLAASAGGTGQSSLTLNNVILGNGTSGVQFVAPSTSGNVLKSNGTTWTSASLSSTYTAPTVQKFLSGSGTYTTPTTPAPLYIRVRMVGGGGGGGSGGTSGTNSGTAGTASTFGTSLLSAGGGAGGSGGGGAHVGGGAGGTSSLGTGPIGIALTGGQGGGASTTPTGFNNLAGGNGGASAFGGGGTDGTAASSNTGSGGGGGGTATSSNIQATAGAGGGAGGFVDAVIASPSATYAYSVGVGNAGGSAGVNGSAGGAGGSGLIIVEEFYQ